MVPVWKKELAQAWVDPAAAFAAIKRPTPPPHHLDALCGGFPFRVPRYYFSLIDPHDPNDPIARQCLPDIRELDHYPSDCADAIGDLARRPVSMLVRKHANRAILLVSSSCAMYCRFCFRRSPSPPGQPVSASKLEEAFKHIDQNPELHEIILSGGDPLTLSDRNLSRILSRLRSIPHVKLLRIHSRAPATLPSRLTSELAEMLRKHAPLFLVTHFNHPRELTELARKGILHVRDAGIPILNQTVLLKGINDDAEVLASLSWALLEAGITPYYLHQCDREPGTGPFRTSLSRGRRLMAELQTRVPGHGLPRYMLDVPDGQGKVSMITSAAEEIEPGHWEIQTPSGETCVYIDEPSSS